MIMFYVQHTTENNFYIKLLDFCGKLKLMIKVLNLEKKTQNKEFILCFQQNSLNDKLIMFVAF